MAVFQGVNFFRWIEHWLHHKLFLLWFMMQEQIYFYLERTSDALWCPSGGGSYYFLLFHVCAPVEWNGKQARVSQIWFNSFMTTDYYRWLRWKERREFGILCWEAAEFSSYFWSSKTETSKQKWYAKGTTLNTFWGLTTLPCNRTCWYFKFAVRNCFLQNLQQY